MARVLIGISDEVIPNDNAVDWNESKIGGKPVSEHLNKCYHCPLSYHNNKSLFFIDLCLFPFFMWCRC